MRLQLLLCVVLALALAGLAFAKEEDKAAEKVKAAVREAKAKLAEEEELFVVPEAKAGSRKRKATTFSRAMETHNALADRAASLLGPDADGNTTYAVVNSALLDRQGIPFNLAAVNEACSPPSVRCDAGSPFRTISGVCNNLNNPNWGSAGTALRRLRRPAYADGRDSPRGDFISGVVASSSARTVGFYLPNRRTVCAADNRRTLPNPRFISRAFLPPQDVPDRRLTHMVTQMGQFLDHDLTLSPEPEIETCCTQRDSRCWTIAISREDDFFSRHGQQCMGFSRSTPFCRNLSPTREQFNDITAFVDASNVYGSDDSTARQLRDPNRPGELRASFNNLGREMLPRINGEFEGGDKRAVENPTLASMHILFLREHNRIARQIRNLRPRWSSDDIYHVARRIVGAEMQNIVYNEYLPAILGDRVVNDFGLNVNNGRTNYFPNIDPGIKNSFSTAAYRFGHSMVQDMVLMVSTALRGRRVTETYDLKDHFDEFDKPLERNGLGTEELLMGLLVQPAQTNDNFVADTLTNHLFNEGQPFGSDLVARNIQRGRDHGLPGYNAFREFCGLPKACSWDRAPPEVDALKWRALSRIYDNPEDIDLFVGGLAERPHAGGVSGRTFSCIKAVQFRDLRYGDRFFFTHGRQAGSFNDGQLANLRARRLADVICDNTQITHTPPNVFRLTSASDERPCTSRVPIDVSRFL